MNKEFENKVLSKFYGCDTDELAAGTKENQSIWLMGIEHGTWKSEKDANIEADNYSVARQLTWPYNQKAFKLLSVIHGYNIKEYIEFANKYQPFVKGNAGFFKGNLYPYGLRTVNDFTEEVKIETGFKDKNEYYNWCNKNRLPVIKEWIDEYMPKIVIALGISQKDNFSKAVFDEKVQFKEENFLVNQHKKRFYYFNKNGKKLVVLPHFSGAHGLNSDESIEIVGKFIKDQIEIN